MQHKQIKRTLLKFMLQFIFDDFYMFRTLLVLHQEDILLTQPLYAMFYMHLCQHMLDCYIKILKTNHTKTACTTCLPDDKPMSFETYRKASKIELKH
jgi:hypothetical protein